MLMLLVMMMRLGVDATEVSSQKQHSSRIGCSFVPVAASSWTSMSRSSQVKQNDDLPLHHGRRVPPHHHGRRISSATQAWAK